MPTAALRFRRLVPSVGFVPLAWRNLVANRPRLLRSSGGIAFAVLLMLMQLGFERAFFNASLDLLQLLDGDIFLQSASKYRFATRDPFAGSELDAARSVPGVASAWPLYAAWIDVFWKNPSDGKIFLVRTLGFDPNQPVLRLPKLEGNSEQLHDSDTVLIDRDARKFLGMDPVPSQSELNGLPVRVVGSFALGPNFESDGTAVVGDQTFGRLLPGPGGGPPGIELGVIKLRPGFELAAMQNAIRAKLPPTIAVMTKDQLLELERNFQADVSSAGPIFAMGTLVGFVVGMLIAYQIIYTDLSEQLPQYATMKAIGYRTRYLIRVVLEQAAFSGLAGWIPACLFSLLLYRVIGTVALLPMRMTWNIALTSLVLTLGMCLISAIIAVRRVIALDPAEVF